MPTSVPRAIKKIVPRPVKAVYHTLRQGVSAAITRYGMKADRHRSVAVSRLLMGGDNGQTGERFAQLTGNAMRPSTPISQSPHARLLRDWQQFGERLFDAELFQQTDYFRNAVSNIDLFGFYFDARCERDIVVGAKRFVNCFRGDSNLKQLQIGQSEPGAPVIVRPILNSDCYQIADGHHRLAIASVRGETQVSVLIRQPEVVTPVQRLVSEVMWLNGRQELYQPVDVPELESEWKTVRRCTDRFDKMRTFLARENINSGTHIDVGCSYGWFVNKFRQCGFDSCGVDRDPIALQVGKTVYGLASERLVRSDCARFLIDCTVRYDIVSCFSVLHHYVMQSGRVNAVEFVRLLDRITDRVLFLETGHGHEEWYKNSLRGWDEQYIRDWLITNTSFSSVVSIGIDEDRVAPFEHNFGRTLFACTR